MRIEKKQGAEERSVLIGMLTDRYICGTIAERWKAGGLFASSWVNLIAGWAVRYYHKYDDAPKKAVQGIYQRWADKNTDDEHSALIAKFLGSISSEYEKGGDLNKDYILDTAGRIFNKVRLARLAEKIQAALDMDDFETAENACKEDRAIELGDGAILDPLQDQEAITAAFEETSEPLFHFPGALGEFFGDHLERDGFIAFMGPEKSGKSMWLLKLTWQALRQRCRVIMFQCGDMSQNQIMKRMMSLAAKRPLRSGEYGWPKEILRDADGVASVLVENKHFDRPLSPQDAIKASAIFQEDVLRSQNSYLKLSCHATGELSVGGMEGKLEALARDNWTPDVIVVDYADILTSSAFHKEARDKTNSIWEELRKLSQKQHCLVATATQTNALSYTATTLNRSHFSNDKRKFAHVTGMIGINMTDYEKENGLQRLNWLALREGGYNAGKCVTVAGHLAFNNIAIKSTW